MKSMEFTTASISQTTEAIKKHSEEFETIRKESSNMSIEEVAQKMIIDKFGDAQIEAEEIVNDLKKGLEDFDTQFKKNKETEKINVAERLEDATKNNSEEERKNCYVNILTAIELLNNKEISKDEVNAKLAENAELTIEELLTKIEDKMNSTISLDSLVNNVKNGLNSDVLSQLAKNIELNKDDYRFMAAFWLYVEQREGNLKLSDSEFAVSAVELGALAGASVEAIIANNDLQEGKIDVAVWQKVMKWILGALIGIALGFLAILIVANIGMLALTLVWAIFGTGTVALIFSMFVSLYVAWHVSDFVSETWIKILELYSDFYNKHIAGVTAKISSWITIAKTWITNMVDKVKAAFNNNKEGQMETQQGETEIVGTNVNEENVQGQQPVMA